MRRIMLTVLSIALLSAGCGSDDAGQDVSTDSAAAGAVTAEASDSATESEDDGGSAEGGDGCDLISDEVAAEILGIEIVRREAHEDATTGGISCIKGTERVEDLKQASYVSVSATPNGVAYFDETIAEAETESIPGVGDRAEFLASAGTMLIAAGDDLVTVQVVKGGVPSGLDDCLTVAEDVLANL